MNRLWVLILSMIAVLGVSAQDEDLRINPEHGSEAAESLCDVSYAQYPYLRPDVNVIELNGEDWRGVCRLFECADDSVISIVHIGDSHIQAEGSTSRTRRMLQNRYGSAGRGLIIPYRLTGTNQPLDYTITAEAGNYRSAKLMKHPWESTMGFTGISLTPTAEDFEFSLSMENRSEISPDFDIVRIYLSDAQNVVITGATTPADPVATIYATSRHDDHIDVRLLEPATALTVKMHLAGDCAVFGFELLNSMAGVEYSAIGNNGATYASYNEVGGIGRSLQPLHPHIVVISLGANEAFGRVSDEQMYSDIDILVRDIQQSNPQTCIVLCTPSECQRSIRRRRRRRTYQVNDNIPRLRQVILKYGRDNAVATYDWYAVAGGAGSSTKWLADKLMNTDRIHNTWSGYDVQGALFYEALQKAISTTE